MSEWGTGYAIGIVTGLAIGLVAARKRKPWDELTKREKRVRFGIISFIGISALAGIALLLVVL